MKITIFELGTRDYVVDITHLGGSHHATFGSNRASGGFPLNRGNWKYNAFVTLLLSCPFFSILRLGRTDTHILTLNCSNDLFPPKDCPSGGQDDDWRHMEKICPKSSTKGAWIGSFKPKCQNLCIAISSELLIRRTSTSWRLSSDHERHVMGGPPLLQSKYNMAGGRHLENR